jgi:hypothetical protein
MLMEPPLCDKYDARKLLFSLSSVYFVSPSPFLSHLWAICFSKTLLTSSPSSNVAFFLPEVFNLNPGKRKESRETRRNGNPRAGR